MLNKLINYVYYFPDTIRCILGKHKFIMNFTTSMHAFNLVRALKKLDLVSFNGQLYKSWFWHLNEETCMHCGKVKKPTFADSEPI
jgi:hypothetical protein